MCAISQSLNTNSRVSTRTKQTDFRWQNQYSCLKYRFICTRMSCQSYVTPKYCAVYSTLLFSVRVLKIHNTQIWNQYNVDGTATTLRTGRSRVRIPVATKNFSLQRPDRFWVPGSFPGGWAAGARRYLQPATRLRMSGAIPPPLYTIMAWPGTHLPLRYALP